MTTRSFGFLRDVPSFLPLRGNAGEVVNQDALDVFREEDLYPIAEDTRLETISE